MPVHPSEEKADPGSITEKVAKNPSSNTDSTASDHPEHKHNQSGGLATAQDHQAQPGPAIPQSMDDVEKPKSKDELKARAAELNK